MVSSTTRTGQVPRPLAVALDALQKIAEEATLSCLACRDLRAAVAAGRRADPRAEPEREHRRLCPGVHAWDALAKIARGEV